MNYYLSWPGQVDSLFAGFLWHCCTTAISWWVILWLKDAQWPYWGVWQLVLAVRCGVSVFLHAASYSPIRLDWILCMAGFPLTSLGPELTKHHFHHVLMVIIRHTQIEGGGKLLRQLKKYEYGLDIRCTKVVLILLNVMLELWSPF